MSRREEEVIEQALRQVETRRRRRGGQVALRWFIAWWALVLVAFFVIPWPLDIKVRASVHGLCAQVQSHMPCYDGQPMVPFAPPTLPCTQWLPLCSRDSGLYVGALLGTVYLLARGRWRAAGRPARWFWVVLIVVIALFVVDVLNSVAEDWFQGRLLYTPDNTLRLATGLLLGLAISVLLLWVINLAFADRRLDRSILSHWGDLGGLLLAGAVGGVALGIGWPPLYIPMTVLSVGGAVAMLLAGNALAILTVTRGKDLLNDDWEAFPLLLWGSVLAVLEMALLSWLRYRVGG